MAIVDIHGNRLTKTSFAKAAIITSDDGTEWSVMRPQEVPSWVKDREVMSRLMDGEIVSIEADGPYYYAERVN